MKWWQWLKLAGAIGAVFLIAVTVVNRQLPSSLVVALVGHLVTDFTLQSGETAARKPERGRHLLVHALAAGGVPLALTTLVMGQWELVGVAAVVGAAAHYAIDYTRKFGLKSVAGGVLLDQLSHVALLVGWVALTR